MTHSFNLPIISDPAASSGSPELIITICIFIGVFIFLEAYPLFEQLYMAKDLGAPFVYDALGLSRGVFALILILAAIGMFYVGEWAEKKFPREEY